MIATRVVPRAYVILTGRSEGRRHLIFIGEQPVWLARRPFRAFCRLVAERLNMPDNFLPLPVGDVCALRRVLKRPSDEWLTAPFTISTGSGATYALFGDLTLLAVDDTFAALAKGRTLPSRVVECIVSGCRPAE